MLEVNKVTKKCQDKIILNKLSFTVKRGEIAIFLGSSGVGKSTLLRVLNSLESYDEGAVLLDSKPLDASQNQSVGMVFQHFNLFDHLTVEENITLPLVKVQKKNKEEAEVIAHNILIRYGLMDKINVRADRISGGQKQRLAIARTLALNPDIICLDEPTSALDPLLTTQVAEYIEDIAKDNKVVLLTTHNINFLKRLNGTIFLMKEGSIIESVKTADLNQSNCLAINEFIEGVLPDSNFTIDTI